MRNCRRVILQVFDALCGPLSPPSLAVYVKVMCPLSSS